MLKTVVCMKWGVRYPTKFVNRLYKAVRRNVTGDLRFVCFTDDASTLIEGVEAQPLPHINLPDHLTWLPWRKLSLWQPGLAGLEGDVLFLDIDLVVTGNLDPIWSYHPGEMCVAENWTQPGRGIGNTSVYRWRAGTHTEIYEQYQRDREAVHALYRVEQKYVSAMIKSMTYWPADWCVSFKHSLLPKFPMNWVQTPPLPEETKVVAFTGRPDQDQARDGLWPAPWYKKAYKHTKPTPWIAEHWRD